MCPVRKSLFHPFYKCLPKRCRLYCFHVTEAETYKRFGERSIGGSRLPRSISHFTPWSASRRRRVRSASELRCLPCSSEDFTFRRPAIISAEWGGIVVPMTWVLRMRFGSGSYDVRRSEGLNPSLLANARHTITCTVSFLDTSERQFLIDVSAPVSVRLVLKLKRP